MLFLRIFFIFSLLILNGLGFIALLDPKTSEFLLIDIASKPLLSVSIGVLILSVLWFCRSLYHNSNSQNLDKVILSLSISASFIFAQSLSLEAPASVHTEIKNKLKIVFANLWYQNPHPEKLMGFINEKDPDIVAVVEVTPLSLQRLKPLLKEKYPYSTPDAQAKIFSKFPIKNLNNRTPRLSLMQVEIKTSCAAVPFGLVHMTRPWPFTEKGSQTKQINTLSTAIKRLNWDDNPKHILMGDFNHTLHTSELKKFRSDNNLKVHKGTEGTWPSFAPNALRIRIDQMMAGPAWIPTIREVGPDYGSDHMPIYGEFVSADHDCASADFSVAPMKQH